MNPFWKNTNAYSISIQYHIGNITSVLLDLNFEEELIIPFRIRTGIAYSTVSEVMINSDRQ